MAGGLARCFQDHSGFFPASEPVIVMLPDAGRSELLAVKPWRVTPTELAPTLPPWMQSRRPLSKLVLEGVHAANTWSGPLQWTGQRVSGCRKRPRAAASNFSSTGGWLRRGSQGACDGVGAAAQQVAAKLTPRHRRRHRRCCARHHRRQRCQHRNPRERSPVSHVHAERVNRLVTTAKERGQGTGSSCAGGVGTELQLRLCRDLCSCGPLFHSRRRYFAS